MAQWVNVLAVKPEDQTGTEGSQQTQAYISASLKHVSKESVFP